MIRRIALAALLTLGLVLPAFAETVTGYPPYTPGQIVGTITNDNAAAGNVGEYVSSTVLSGSAVSLTSTIVANVTSVSLTTGDWDCQGRVSFVANAATTSTNAAGAITSTSATLPGVANAFFTIPMSTSAGQNAVYPTGMMRFSLAATTTVYLVAVSTFAVNTMGGAGFIGCRRAR